MKALCTLLTSVGLAAHALAIPQLINYQGYLTSSSGTPLDTTVAMTFNLYTDAFGSTQVWAETQPSVVVSEGLFHVNLGQVTPLNDSSLNLSEVWLGIRVGSDSEMSPLTRLVSAAYSYRVGTVDGASGGAIGGKLNVGTGNMNSGSYANVFGQNNTAGGTSSTISGGIGNAASEAYDVVAGGHNNTAAGGASTVSGGEDNMASDAYSTVSGGASNTASGSFATASGGGVNSVSGGGASISGGLYNVASGVLACIPGGAYNRASGDTSFAAGAFAKALYNGSFVWGSSTTHDSTVSFNHHSVTFRCQSGARFYTHPSNNTGVQLPAGGGAWSSLCDVNQKNLHGGVNTSDILHKVSTLPLYRWSYKAQDSAIRHIGPTSQDFYETFGLGDNNTTISTLDPDGVALAAIQELAREYSELKTQNSNLEDRITRLETKIQTLVADRQLSTTLSPKEK